MPTVPIEQNKIGLADVTDAKFRPGDFSGSGLGAIGAGMQSLGEAGQAAASNFKDAQDLAEKRRQADLIKAAIRAGQTQDPAAAEPAQQPRQDGHEILRAQDPQGLFDDAAIKAGWNQYGAETTPILYSGKSAYFTTSGFAAANAQKTVTDQITAIHDRIRDSLPPDLRPLFDRSAGSRFALDLDNINAHTAQQFGVEQERQTSAVIEGSVNDAVNHRDDPAIADKFLATGAENLIAQRVRKGVGIDQIRSDVSAYYSNAYLKTIYEDAQGDPLGAVARFRKYNDAMTEGDRRKAQQMLFAPLAELLGVADVDGLPQIASTTAPATPPTRGAADLDARMLAISPPDSAASGGTAGGQGVGAANASALGLSALVQRYRGDAAKAWAASRIGTDALDAAIAGKGDAWLGAIPDYARKYVLHNMALLNAAGSQRLAPAPQDRAAAAQAIDAQDWTEERKQIAHAELNRRIGLADQRSVAKAAAATNAALALADDLGPGFISPNQIPPATRDDLPPETLAALERRAWQNSNPTPVAPHGRTVHDLNQLAAEHPELFVKQDLRLVRDLVTPDEYASLGRLQQGLQGYPPSADAMTQRRSQELLRQAGLDVITPRPVLDTDAGNPQPPSELLPAAYVAPMSTTGADTDATASDGAAEADAAGSDAQGGPGAAAAPNSSPSAQTADAKSAAPPVNLSQVDSGFGGLGHGVNGDYRTTERQQAWLAEPMRMARPAPPYPAGNSGTDQKSPEKLRQIREYVAYLYTLPEVKALLDVFAHTEVTEGDGYYRSHYPDKNKLPDLKSFHGTVPIGRYQIALKNWRNYGEAWWSRPDFSPISQDIVAITLLQQGHVIDELMRGNLSGAFSKAAKIFASIPMSSKQDYSGYVGGRWDPHYDPKTQEGRQPSPVRFNDLPALFVARLNARRQEFREAKQAWETHKVVPWAFISPLKWQSLGNDGFAPSTTTAN